MPPAVDLPPACALNLAQVDELTRASLVAYVLPDMPGFYSNLNDLQGQLPCLRQPLSPAQAAQLHLLDGLARTAGRDEQGAVSAYRAAYEADPALTLPFDPEDIPEVHNQLRQANAQGVSARVPLPEVPGAQLLVDGTLAQERPSTRPYVLQIVWEEDRAVHHTLYLPASALEPDLRPFLPDPPLPPAPELPPAGLVRAAGVSSVLAVGLLSASGLALQGWARVTDPVDPGREALEVPLWATFQATGYAGVGVGAVALGLDLALVVRAVRARQPGTP